MENLSFLDIVNVCDNTRVHRPSPVPSTYDSELLVPLYLSESPDSPVIGLLRPVIIEQLTLENRRSRELGIQELWAFNLDAVNYIHRNNKAAGPSVSFRDWLNTHVIRTAAMKELCERWRDNLSFEDVCGPKKWRDEMYPVYVDPLGVHDHPNQGSASEVLNFAFEMERSACALFGVITYGVHMTIYEEDGADGENRLKAWVPTRSRTKQTFPGLLDNTVAGGIPSGMPVFESMVKECMEEASIADHIVRKYARAVGSISYFYRTSKGWLQPEVEYVFTTKLPEQRQLMTSRYVYDIQIPPEVDSKIFEPRPLDGEVELFELTNTKVKPSPLSLPTTMSKYITLFTVAVWDIGLTLANLVTPKRKVGKVTPAGHPGEDGKWPEFIAPKEGDSRCCCPGLNVMANHGLIPRDGKNISFKELSHTLNTTFNFGPSFCFFVPNFAAKMLKKKYSSDRFDLAEMDLHNGIEHDASLFRRDVHFETKQSTIHVPFVKELLESATGKDADGNPIFTQADLSLILSKRRAEARAENPEFTLDKFHKLVGTANSSTLLTIFGGRIKDLETILLEERLPEGWESRTRESKGLTFITLNTLVAKVEKGIDESKFAAVVAPTEEPASPSSVHKVAEEAS
ncbi:hypothetical protein DXG01_012994 [Tephrocybe rancida]|nr:hypothetical protein DXG01_012994 [Tephrocybe rancida]